VIYHQDDIYIYIIFIRNKSIFYDKGNESREKIDKKSISPSPSSNFLTVPLFSVWIVFSPDTLVGTIHASNVAINFYPFFFRSTYLLYSQNPGNLSARGISKLQAAQCRTNPPSFVLDSLPCFPTSRPLDYPRVHSTQYPARTFSSGDSGCISPWITGSRV
jgi:hypothetical protein